MHIAMKGTNNGGKGVRRMNENRNNLDSEQQIQSLHSMAPRLCEERLGDFFLLQVNRLCNLNAQ